METRDSQVGSMNTIDVTVAICTHNGAERIGHVLRSLCAQETTATWEVLIVDNAGTDDLAGIAASLSGDLPVPLRVVREPRAGLSFARALAGLEAEGEVVCFLDDDNPAEKGFVGAAADFFRAHPVAGIAGGKVMPEWECTPTALAASVCEFALAVNDRGDAEFRYEELTSGPVGAGMCIRADLLRSIYADPVFATCVTGRRGKSLASGEDAALCVKVRQRGAEAWYVPSMRCRHRIPAERMELAYLLRLYAGIGRGQAAVRRLHDRKARNLMLVPVIAARDALRWLRGCVSSHQVTDVGDRKTAAALHALHQRQLLARAAATLRIRS